MTVMNVEREDEPADVCVIGAGPVGLALALSLEQQGKRVLLIEAGPDRGARQTEAAEVMNRHHAPLDIANGSGLGGGASLWGGRCVAYDDIDFDTRSYVEDSGWPIKHEDLSQYYDEAFEFLNVTRSAVMPSGLCTDKDIHLDAIEWWSSDPSLVRKYRSRILGSKHIRYLANARVVGMEMGSGGRCITRIEIKYANGEAFMPVRKLVLACGGIGNTRLLLSLQKQLDNALSPMIGHFYQGHLTGYIAVLEIEDERLEAELLFQRGERDSVFRRRMQFSNSLQRQSEVLNTIFWMDSFSISDPLHRSATLSALYLFLKAVGLYTKLSYGKAAGSKPRDRQQNAAHFRNLRFSFSLRAFRALVKTMRTLRSRMPQIVNPAGRYLLRYHAEQVPKFESRVFDASSAAAGSSGSIGIDYRVCEQDLVSVLKSHQILDDWLQRNRLGRLHYLHPERERLQALKDQAYDGFHQIGLTRMATTPDRGVVDEHCRVHGLANLYIAGSSVFPTSGQANPTLPAVAMALRLAHELGAGSETMAVHSSAYSKGEHEPPWPLMPKP